MQSAAPPVVRRRPNAPLYRAVFNHPRTPLLGKCCLGLAVLYAIMSFDLVPDFIPLVGYLDDVLIIPALIALAIWFIPGDIVHECRRWPGE